MPEPERIRKHIGFLEEKLPKGFRDKMNKKIEELVNKEQKFAAPIHVEHVNEVLREENVPKDKVDHAIVYGLLQYALKVKEANKHGWYDKKEIKKLAETMTILSTIQALRPELKEPAKLAMEQIAAFRVQTMHANGEIYEIPRPLQMKLVFGTRAVRKEDHYRAFAEMARTRITIPEEVKEKMIKVLKKYRK